MYPHGTERTTGLRAPIAPLPAGHGSAGVGRPTVPGTLLDSPVRGALQWPRIAALTVALCAALAFALRLHTLGDRPLWVDEAGSWAYALLDVPSLFGVMGRVEPTPPNYYLLIKLWMALGDGSEFWLRLSSALAGAVSVLLFGLFLQRAFGPAAAIWGAAFLAVAGGHLRYTQEVRVYSFIFMLFVLGLLLAERLVDAMRSPAARRRQWRLAVGLGIASGVMINLHYSAAFAAATLYVYGLCLLIAERRATVGRVAVLVASGLGGLLLAVPVLSLAVGIAAGSGAGAYWEPPPGLAQAFFEFEMVLFAPQLHRMALPGTLLSLAALGACLWAGRRHPQVAALSAAFVFAAASFFAVSQVVPIMMGRTVLFTLALTAAVLACGLAELGRRPWLLAAMALAAFAPQVKGSANQLASPNFYGEVWDDVARRITREAAPSDSIVTIGAFETTALDYYLMREGALRARAAIGDAEGGVNSLAIALMTGATPIHGADLAGSLCEALPPGDEVWLVSRGSRIYADVIAAAGRALATAGAARRSSTMHGGILVERWSPPARCG